MKDPVEVRTGWFDKGSSGLSMTGNKHGSLNKLNFTNPKDWWRTLQLNLKSQKKFRNSPTFRQSIRAVITASWLNVLLVFIPISWAVHWGIPDTTVSAPLIKFVTSFFAIIPLAKLMGFATEELALRVGETIGGLLNATLGNAVELIVAIIAMLKCELRIVQSSLVGSILSNLLLVLGMCFFAGGTKFSEQGFAASASQLNSSLLVVSVIAVLLPAAFHFAVNAASTDTNSNVDADQGTDILRLSRGISVILLITYGAYLIFQLWSHAHLYQDNAPDNFKSTAYPASHNGSTHDLNSSDEQPKSPTGETTGTFRGQSKETDQSIAPRRNANGSANVEGENTRKNDVRQDPEDPKTEDDEEGETPQLSVWMSFLTLVVVTVLVALTAEFLVDSIQGLTDRYKISQEWVGLILLPIVGNAAEHVTAVTVSVKDKLTLSLGVAAGSSIQIALFVIPFMVLLAWIVSKPLTLLFDPFESITLFLAVTTVNYVTADGRTNWLEGLVLINLYFIIGVMFWYYPGSDPSGVLNTCT